MALVTRPPYLGGLGFTFKWNMGGCTTLSTTFSVTDLSQTPSERSHVCDAVSSQREFILPLSHDEVVHGKRSLLGRMPGDDWRRFANQRMLLGYQWLFPERSCFSWAVR